MLKDYNFKKIITFISIVLLFFASSVNYIAYAKMKAIADSDLADIQGQEGVTIGLNLTAGTVSDNMALTLRDEGGAYIELPHLAITNGTGTGQFFSINTNLTIDVGTNGGTTSVFINGIALPSNPEGIHIKSDDVRISGQVIGSVAAAGLYMGVSAGGYTAGSSWVRLFANNNSISGYASTGLYADSIKITASPSSNMTVSGLYIGSAASYATGSALIGLTQTSPGVTAANPFKIDVGTSGSDTLINLSLPMTASIHINNFYLNGNNWGAIDLDNVTFYRQWVSLRNNL